MELSRTTTGFLDWIPFYVPRYPFAFIINGKVFKLVSWKWTSLDRQAFTTSKSFANDALLNLHMDLGIDIQAMKVLAMLVLIHIYLDLHMD